MKSLEERLKERKDEYDKMVAREHLTQSFLDKVLEVVPESNVTYISVNSLHASIHLSFHNVDEFEELYISKLSEKLGIVWERSVLASTISHSALKLLDKDNYHVFLYASSKPTDSCSIIKIPTGKTIKRMEYVEVEEPEYEYLVDCKDE